MNVDAKLFFTDAKYKKNITFIFGDKKGCSYINCRNAKAGMKQLRHMDRDVHIGKEIEDFSY
jgi:hypothetical protein